MSWIKENSVTWIQMFCIKIIKTGRIPQHIAFIMDGNRRYAKRKNVSRKEGHSKGFEKLSETLKWCLDLGIPEVTVYAFSIENFKRTQDEVDTLMDLANEKFDRLLTEVDQMNAWGVGVHVVGRLSLLPKTLRAKVARTRLLTRHNNKLRLNIAYAYTGRDEMTRTMGDIVQGTENGEILPEDIDEELMSATMELTDPQLLIRTSGEVRLSDFMLWQLSDSVIYFSDVLWPDFSIWNLLGAILHYQRMASPGISEPVLKSERCSAFLKNLEERRQATMERYIQDCN